MAIFRNRTLTEEVTEWLSQRIISGDLAPGQVLSESDLASQLGTSRTPLREALRILSREGLVNIVPRRGCVVAMLTEREAADLYETRALIEGFCTKLTVQSMTPAEYAELQKVIDEMETAVEKDGAAEYFRLNALFHEKLYSFCPNKVLFELVNITWRRMLRYRMFLWAHFTGRLGRSLENHRAVMRAIEERDAEAAGERISKLIAEAAADLLANFRAYKAEESSKSTLTPTAS